jgi:hypothetical protein
MCSSIFTMARIIIKKMGNKAINLLENHIHSNTTNPNENNKGIIGNPSTSCGRVQPRKTISNFILVNFSYLTNQICIMFFVFAVFSF